MMKRLVLVAALLALPGRSLAQPAPAPEPAPPDASQPHPPPPPAYDLNATYDQAYQAMLAGDFAKAAQGFAYVAAQSSDPEQRAAAREMARLASGLRASGARLLLPGGVAGAGAQLVTQPAPDDEPDAGRTSFIVTTTMAAFYSSIYLIDLLDQGDSVQAATLVVMGGTALGVLGSVYGSRGRTITAGMADAYSLGIGIGAGNAALLVHPLNQTDTSERVETFILGGLVVGGIAGYYAGYQFRPTSGQVGYIGDVSVLGLATAGLGLLIVQPSVSADSILVTLTAGLDAGLALGLFTAGKLDWSPSRQRLISLGIFLGALAGWGVTAMIYGDSSGASGDDVARVLGSATLAGMWGGAALTWHLTRNMKPDKRFQPNHGVQLNVGPTAVRALDGTRPGVALAGTF